MASLKQIMNVDEDNFDSDSHKRAQDADPRSARASASTPSTSSYSSATNPPFASSSSAIHSFNPSSSTGPLSRAAHSVVAEAPSSSSSPGTVTANLRRVSSTSTESMDSSYYAQSQGHGQGYDGHPMSSSAGPSRSHMMGAGGVDGPPRLTPITGRVSRAKKGQPVHVCELCRPPKPFTRAEHLRRHQLSHDAPTLLCQADGCGRVFYRKDLFERHRHKHEQENKTPTHDRETNIPGRHDHHSYPPGPDHHPDVYNTVPPYIPSSESAPSVEGTMWPGRNDSGYVNSAPNASGAGSGPFNNQDQLYMSSWPVASFPPNPMITRQNDWVPGSFVMTPRTHDPSINHLRRYSSLTTSPPHLGSTAMDSYESSLDVGLSEYTTESSALGSHDLSHNTVRSLPPTLAEGQSSESLVAFSSAIPTGLAPSSVPCGRQMAEKLDPLAVTAFMLPASLSEDTRRTIPAYIDVYWEKVNPDYPIIHRSTFDVEEVGTEGGRPTKEHAEMRRCAMAAIATQFLGDETHRIHGNELYAYASSKSMERVQAQDWSLEVMQTALLCEYFARFRGKTKNSYLASERFRLLYRNVADHKNTFAPMPTGRSTVKLWKEWVQIESRRRLLAACFLLDVHSARYFQKSHVSILGVDYSSTSTLHIPLSRGMNDMWDAVDARAWHNLSKGGRNVRVLSTALSHPLTAGDIARAPPFDAAILLAGFTLGLSEARGFDWNRAGRTVLVGSELAHLSSLFRDSGIANTYAALHHTPLHDLLSVSGDSWLFNEKILQVSVFMKRKKNLMDWSKSDDASIAAFFAIRGLVSFLNLSRKTAGQVQMVLEAGRTSPWKDISDYWGLYVCALVCWGFGQGKGEVAQGEDASGADDDASRATALEWILSAAELELGQLSVWSGRGRTRAMICLARDILTRDCPSGRNRMFNDAVIVLRNLGGREANGF